MKELSKEKKKELSKTSLEGLVHKEEQYTCEKKSKVKKSLIQLTVVNIVLAALIFVGFLVICSQNMAALTSTDIHMIESAFNLDAGLVVKVYSFVELLLMFGTITFLFIHNSIVYASRIPVLKLPLRFLSFETGGILRNLLMLTSFFFYVIIVL